MVVIDAMTTLGYWGIVYITCLYIAGIFTTTISLWSFAVWNHIDSDPSFGQTMEFVACASLLGTIVWPATQYECIKMAMRECNW